MQPYVLFGLAEIVGKLASSIFIIINTHNADLTAAYIGDLPDGVVPAIRIERAVVDCLDNRGEGFKRNLRRFDASGHALTSLPTLP